MKLLFLVNLISFIFSIKDFRPIKKCHISNLSFDNYLSSTPYRSGDIDSEVIEAWNEKKLNEPIYKEPITQSPCSAVEDYCYDEVCT